MRQFSAVTFLQSVSSTNVLNVTDNVRRRREKNKTNNNSFYYETNKY